MVFAFFVGTFMIVQYFVPHPTFLMLYNVVLDWKQVVFGFVLIVGTLSMVKHHILKVRFKKAGHLYSVVTLVGLVAMVQHIHPDTVLIMSGDLAGITSEIAKYPVRHLLLPE